MSAPRLIPSACAAALLALLVAACRQGPPAPDMAPVGGGLSVIGLGIVVAALLLAFSKGGR